MKYQYKMSVLCLTWSLKCLLDMQLDWTSSHLTRASGNLRCWRVAPERHNMLPCSLLALYNVCLLANSYRLRFSVCKLAWLLDGSSICNRKPLKPLVASERHNSLKSVSSELVHEEATNYPDSIARTHLKFYGTRVSKLISWFLLFLKRSYRHRRLQLRLYARVLFLTLVDRMNYFRGSFQTSQVLLGEGGFVDETRRRANPYASVGVMYVGIFIYLFIQ